MKSNTVGVFPGSFTPFTIGHKNIFDKAEKIFGEGNVIIAFGVNPDKTNALDVNNIESKCDALSDKLNGVRVDYYTGFLHDYIDMLEKTGYNPVIIRGLRNGDDLDYEINQLRFISDFKPGINTIFIACDKEYEHISSSAIKTLEKFNKHTEYLP